MQLIKLFLNMNISNEVLLNLFNVSFKIDILVNNAGRSQRSLIVDTPLEVDRQVIDLDLLAPISVTKAVLPHMIKQGQGHITCTSSVAGKLGAPGSGIYSSAKHGLQVIYLIKVKIFSLRIMTNQYQLINMSISLVSLLTRSEMIHIFIKKIKLSL